MNFNHSVDQPQPTENFDSIFFQEVTASFLLMMAASTSDSVVISSSDIKI